MVVQMGSSLSAKYQPKPAAGPSPLGSYSGANSGLLAVVDAGGVRQQVADGDRALGGGDA